MTTCLVGCADEKVTVEGSEPFASPRVFRGVAGFEDLAKSLFSNSHSTPKLNMCPAPASHQTHGGTDGYQNTGRGLPPLHPPLEVSVLTPCWSTRKPQIRFHFGRVLPNRPRGNVYETRDEEQAGTSTPRGSAARLIFNPGMSPRGPVGLMRGGDGLLYLAGVGRLWLAKRIVSPLCGRAPALP
ncbi:hypothetical protein P7C70_g9412, partial [Phenoliferia sp. Uapishka_3]